MPRVSVALPVYNGANYLATTLHDLRAQTEADWEAVICDNASTDATPDLLAEAAREDPRIRVVRNERNLGALPNANRAIGRTTGPFVSLWGHDDRHHPDFLRTLTETVESDASAVLAYSASTLIGDDGAPFRWDERTRAFIDAEGRLYDYDRGLERELPRDAVERFRCVLAAGSIDAPIHGVFRREALLSTLPFSLHFTDRHALAKAALAGHFAFVSQPLFAYRLHAGSTYHLDPEAWAERETGTRFSRRSNWRVLVNYTRAAFSDSLSMHRRLAAIRAVGGYAFRRRFRPSGPRSGVEQVESEHPMEGDLHRWAWLHESFSTEQI